MVSLANKSSATDPDTEARRDTYQIALNLGPIAPNSQNYDFVDIICKPSIARDQLLTAM